jgi:sugar-specific transcriptional regulator TrmB
MHVSKVIQQLGYKPNEVKVYLSVLAMGECTISDIAKRVKLPRTSVQMIVDTLHQHGLMSFYVKRRYRYWTAESPERLLTKEREREIALRSVMPELIALRHRGDVKPTVKVFTGTEEIKLIHDDIIDTRHNVLAIIAWERWTALLGERYTNDFIERRAQHFLHMRLLVTESEATDIIKKRDATELRTTHLLPEHTAFGTTTFIYANKVALITLNEKQPTGVVIDDPDIRHTMEIFFEEIWKQGT